MSPTGTGVENTAPVKLCAKCRLVPKNGLKCVCCQGLTHPGCVKYLDNVKILNDEEIICPECNNAGNQARNNVSVQEKDRIHNTSSNGVADIIIEFLKSEEFLTIVATAVRTESQSLRKELSSLHLEMKNLKKSNIDMVRLLSRSNENNKISLSNDPSNFRVDNADSLVQKRDMQGKPLNIPKTKKLSPVVIKPTEETQPSALSFKNHKLESSVEKTSKNNNYYKAKSLIIGSGEQIVNEDGDDFAVVNRIRNSTLHVTRVNPKKTTVDVLNYVNSKIQSHMTSKNVHPNAKVVQLNSKFPDVYSSFKITINSEFIKDLLEPQFWPKGVAVRKFYENSKPKSAAGKPNFQKQVETATAT